MKTFLEFLNESKNCQVKSGRLINNLNTSFSQLRSIFNNLFSCDFTVSDVLSEDDNQGNAVEVTPEIRSAITSTSISPKAALAGVQDDLGKLAAVTGYKASISDYMKDAFANRVVQCANDAGIEVNKNSLFISELADRVNNMSGAKRPSKSDLATYAKREGVSPGSEQYKAFIKNLDETLSSASADIVKPVENVLGNCIGSLGRVIYLPASIDDSKEAKQFRVASDKFFKKYPQKIEINDNTVGDVRQYFSEINDYVNHAKATGKATFKLGDKMYKLQSVFPSLDLLEALMN